MKTSSPSPDRRRPASTAAIALYISGLLAVTAWQVRTQPDHSWAQPARFAVILFLLALPLILLCLQPKNRPAQIEARQNEERRESETRLAELRAEYQEALNELDRYASATDSRENRILELKAEVNELLNELNLTKRYLTAGKTD